MPATAQTAISVIGFDIGKNSFHTSRAGCLAATAEIPPIPAGTTQGRNSPSVPGRDMTLHVQACGDPLLAAWPILYSSITDLDLVRELPAGCAEILLSSGSGCRRRASHSNRPTFAFSCRC
jgi:hypothetical protein